MKISLEDSTDLSLKGKGCTVYCCKHGSAYIIPEERTAIIKATGLDLFVQEGDHFFIGKNLDGTERDEDKDPCPYLTQEDLCSLQETDPSLKPGDCYMHPVFPEEDGNGIRLYVGTCCDLYKHLPEEFIERAKQIIKNYPSKHRKQLYQFNINHGFDSISMGRKV